ELFDDLHGADLGSARDASAGEHAAQHLEKADLIPQDPANRRNAVVDRRMRLDAPRLDHLDRAQPADAAQVIPLQIHDHVELGLILDAVAKLLLHAGPARTRALDRTRDDAAIRRDAEKQLRRIAEKREVAEIEQSAVPRRRLLAQTLVEGDGRLRQRRRKALAEVGLEDVARGDVVDHFLDSREIGLAREA